MRTSLKLIALILLGYNLASAQVSVQVFDYRPTGVLGFVMKPLVSAEVGYMGSFEDSRWRANFSVTYLHLKTRQDTFPEYGVLSDGNGTHITPGYESYSRYNILQLAAGVDFAFIQKENWAIYAGADIIIGATSVAYHDVSILVDETYDGGGYLGGFRGRLGAEYNINDHITVFLNANRSYFIVSDPAGLFSGNNYGLGMRYDF